MAVRIQRQLDLIGEALGEVARVGQLTLLVGLVGVRLGFLDHPADLVLGETRAVLDPDLLLVVGGDVFGVHVDDPVGVDIEGDIDLHQATRRRRDADELELAKRFVEGGHLRLALQDVNLHRGLVSLGGREGLHLARRDTRVARDQSREDAALGLDPE